MAVRLRSVISNSLGAEHWKAEAARVGPLRPSRYGEPGEIRTPDSLVRSVLDAGLQLLDKIFLLR
jgi:hypothetical protein